MGLDEEFDDIFYTFSLDMGSYYAVVEEQWSLMKQAFKEAVCAKRGHDFSCFVGGKQVCQTCGEPYPFAARLPLPTAEEVKGILKDE